MKPLSISSYTTYMECPHKYKLDKIDRIRPVVQPSYFIFGSAVDKGINALLEKKGSPTKECETELKRLTAEAVEFLPADYDGELLDEKQKNQLLKQARGCGYKGDDVDELAKALLSRPYSQLSENQKKALAFCCAASLKAKALLMLQAYETQILPHLSNVSDVQKELRWTDEHGNAFVGVLDFIADGVVRDNKTASRPYHDNAVLISPQLAIYTKVTGATRAGFFVMDKTIRKNRIKTCSECGPVGQGRHSTCDNTLGDGDRCGGEWIETIKPEVHIQVLTDDVSVEEQNITQEALTGVANSIKSGCFPKNLKACRVQYGPKEVKCPYFDYCRNGSMAGLEVKPESKK